MNSPVSLEASVTLSVNGAARAMPAGTTVAALLADLGQDPAAATGIAVAVNDRVVRRADWSATELAEGDTVEVITAKQGG